MHFIKPHTGVPRHIPFLEHSCYTRAAREVGGDFFYHHPVNENETILILGDVSGKGLLASWHTDELARHFDNLFREEISIGEFIIDTNRFISRRFDKHIFVTLFYLHIDAESKMLRYARAGQCPPIFYAADIDTGYYLQDQGIGLGFIRDDSVIQHISLEEHDYEPGDVLFLFSDGLVENTHPQTKEEFGYQRLLADFNSLDKAAHPELLTQAIIRSHENYIGGSKLDDDTSMMMLKFA